MSEPHDPAPAPTGSRPSWWPRFSSTLRSTAVTARLGRALGIAIGICFLTGLLSYYQYKPWGWLPPPADPAWGYRVTQGLHVATGTAALPLLLVKLWSVYPNLFRWPPLRSLRHAIERASVAVLVAAALVQLSTGLFAAMHWYPFGWDFPSVHLYLAFVVVGSVLLHVGVKLPDIRYGLQTKVADGDVLTEVPWWQNPASHSVAGKLPPPATPGLTRRGLLTATGAGLGIVVISTVGQAVTPLERFGLLAVRQPSRGPQGVPVNRTAEQAGVLAAATAADWRLQVGGPRPYALTLAEMERLPAREVELPLAGVEGWSISARWRGVPLPDLVQRAGGGPDSVVRVESLEQRWPFRRSTIAGPQLARALLATHLNGERLSLDHGYPLRLVAPNRTEVLSTKWLARVEVL